MRAIILLSGGLDSTVALALALEKERECHAITFDYGQRHRVEIDAAKKIAAHYNIPMHVMKITPDAFGKSSLLSNTNVPKDRDPEEIESAGVPSTYVPARNTLFLAYALGQAELLDAQEIYFGANALDASPYPDCRPEFVQGFQNLINVLTNPPIKLVTPIIEWTKKKIVNEGRRLSAPIDLSFSCYDPTPEGKACSRCDACILREQAL